MVLADARQIDAAKRMASTRVTVTTLATSAALDNEALRANGLARKVRRAVFANLDNILVMVHLATHDAAGANDADLGRRVFLANYGQFVWEPEKADETFLSFLGTATVRRLSAYLRNLDDTLAPPGLVNGVRIEVDYYDDVEV